MFRNSHLCSLSLRFAGRWWLGIAIGLFSIQLSLLRTASAEPPNVVWIISDDQAWTDYGFMGHAVIETPHLDRLASQSTVFTRGYVPTALCRPSLMTLVTGLYAHQHKTTGNDPSPALASPKTTQYRELRSQLIAHIDRHTTLPTMLGRLGYRSHQSGKWWEGNYRRGGFTAGMTQGFPHPGGRHGDQGLQIGRTGMQPVVEFIQSAVADQRPFFVWYAPFLPHTPHNPPQRLLDKYRSEQRPLRLAKYYAMCEWFDETCGELVGCLDALGIRDNTLVVYVTDNGWIQTTPETVPHGDWKHAFAPRSKQSPYEGGVRTPIMLSWPGQIPVARREELVSSIDLLPTTLSAAKIPIPAGLPGLDLMPLVRDGESLARDTIFGECFAHDIAALEDPQASLLHRWCIEGNWKLLLTYDGATGRYARVHRGSPRGPQLFLLADDPHEKENQAARHPEIVERLANRISEWWPAPHRETVVTPAASR